MGLHPSILSLSLLPSTHVDASEKKAVFSAFPLYINYDSLCFKDGFSETVLSCKVAAIFNPSLRIMTICFSMD